MALGRGALLWPVIALATLLAGCETTPTAIGDPVAAYEAREQRLEKVTQWRAVGKLALKSESDSWSAGLQWKQRDQAFRIRLSAPLGQGMMQLEGSPGQVEMRTADNEVYRARTPDELLYSRVGWRVPLDGLRYWLLGRAQPGREVTAIELDVGGRLQRLEQDGWQIEYQSYREFDGVELPTKLTLRNPRVSAKLVVRSWLLET